MPTPPSANPPTPTARRRWRYLAGLVLCAILLGLGCASSTYLPSAKESVQSPWEDFNAVKTTFDRITPHRTTGKELNELGFDPFTTPNIELLNYLDITQRFMPNQSIRKEDLDEGLRTCLDDRHHCHAYEISLSRMDQDRYGNVLLDIFNFRRKTKVTGWQFKAIVILHDDMVTYKLWSGRPKIDENRDHKNPLGPLQSSERILWSVVDRP